MTPVLMACTQCQRPAGRSHSGIAWTVLVNWVGLWGSMARVPKSACGVARSFCGISQRKSGSIRRHRQFVVAPPGRHAGRHVLCAGPLPPQPPVGRRHRPPEHQVAAGPICAAGRAVVLLVRGCASCYGCSSCLRRLHGCWPKAPPNTQPWPPRPARLLHSGFILRMPRKGCWRLCGRRGNMRIDGC